MFVAVAVVGFTQTRYFRAYLRNLVIERYPEYIDASLHFDKFEGNFVTGTQIHNIMLSRDNEELFAAERIEIKYDPTGFFFNKISVTRVTLVNPRIHIWRSTEGVLNLSQILRPGPKDSASSSPTIEIKEIGLVNAKVTFADSLTLRDRELGLATDPTGDLVDYARIQLDSVHFSASALIGPQKMYARITSLSFESRAPRLEVVRIAGRFTLTPSLASVEDFVFETKRSSVKLDVQVKNVNLATIEKLDELEKAPVQLGINIQKLDARDLKQFLYPHVDFLDRTFAIQGQIRGPFGRLSVERLSVRTPRSFVQAQGTVSNLHQPARLRLDLSFLDNRFHPEDIRESLPGLALPDLRTLGNVQFRLEFQGTPADFNVNLAAETEAGAIQLDGSLKSEHTLTYKARLETSNFDFGVASGRDEFRSSVNARAMVDGFGTDVRSMKAVARIDIDSSMFSEIPLTRSVFVFDIGDAILNSHISAVTGAARVKLSGGLHFLRDSTTYRYEGDISSLNLAGFLKNTSYQSDLSFKLAGSGSWREKSGMRTNAALSFTPSSFNNEKFDSAGARVSFDDYDSTSSRFELISDIADLRVRGSFDPFALVGNVSSAVEILGKGIAHRMKSLDSLRSFLPSQFKTASTLPLSAAGRLTPLDAQFSAEIRNLYPLGVVVHQPLRGACSIEGRIEGDGDSLRFSGEVASPGFSYGAPLTGFGMGDFRAVVDLAGISRVKFFESFHGSVDVQARQGFIAKTNLSGLHIGVKLSGAEGGVDMSVLVDSTTQVDLSGTAAHRCGVYQLNMERVKLGFGPTAYENTDSVLLFLGQDGFQFKSFSLRRETEEISASGYFHPTGVSDLDVSVKGFLLSNLQQMIPQTRQIASLQGIGGIVSGRFLLRGDVEHPNISVDLIVDGFRSRETVFGQVETRLSYFEHLLNVYTTYRYNATDPDAAPDMQLSGTIPYELSLSAAHHHSPKGNIDLKLQSRGMRLDLLSPFLPVVSNVSGFLSCDMKMKGTVDAPEYDGYLVLSAAKFTFMPLGIDYIIDGRFASNKTNIVLEQVTLKNVPQDQSYGRGLMNLTGNFVLEGLKLGRFDLNANGQLLLMKETVRPAGSKFYGDLFAATGPSGIRWNGELSKSFLSGEVQVRNGKLTLPPERETVLLASRNITITYVDDTSKASKSGSSLESPVSRGALLAMNGAARIVDAGTPAGAAEKTPALTQTGEDATTSFLDNIVYDLVIEMQGPTQMRLVVNPITNEELFADMRGRLAFEKKGPTARINGQVEVTNRSYYNYFKRFEATGKLMFTGNALNPELDITGKYETIHRSVDGATPLEGLDSTDQKVLVSLAITGTRDEPKLKFGVQVERKGKYEPWSLGDEESNAITFLLSGQFRDELTASKRQTLITENLVGVTSGVLSAPLREYLRRETGVSMDVLYYGDLSFSQSPDVRLSGELGEAVLRLGGKISNRIENNYNISIEVPMSSLLGIEAWRNLMLTVERRVEGLENIQENRKSSGARLLYRINF